MMSTFILFFAAIGLMAEIFFNNESIAVIAIAIALGLLALNGHVLVSSERFSADRPTPIEDSFRGQKIWILVILVILLPIFAFILTRLGITCSVGIGIC